jgi:uncharacterized lipoprotein YehR (DUF1307 family)
MNAKKALSIVLAAILVVSLAACTGSTLLPAVPLPFRLEQLFRGEERSG